MPFTTKNDSAKETTQLNGRHNLVQCGLAELMLLPKLKKYEAAAKGGWKVQFVLLLWLIRPAH